MFDFQRLKVCEILTRYGIDPNEVAQEGVDASGYTVYLRGADGMRLFNTHTGMIDRERREWPEGCWEEVSSALDA